MSITKETLEKIVSNNNPADLVFIETGTWIGDTIQKALDIGFKEIKSIELSVDLFNKARIAAEKSENSARLMRLKNGEVL
jgi:hypothetical protein